MGNRGSILSIWRGVGTLSCAAVFSLLSVPALAGSDDADRHERGDGGKPYCSKTAKIVAKVCRSEAKDDYRVAAADCLNESDSDERSSCVEEAEDERREAGDDCKEQLQARLDLCDLVGESRYDPDFDPQQFVDPREIGHSVASNPYFPLVNGNQWVYENEDETITVTVTDQTKLIDGVTCVVVHDRVEEDGSVIEDTEDWYAQDLTGNVWYCGEVAQNYELFEGDDPERPELVDIDGSWKAGRDGARPGILMPAAPQVGDVFRQEVMLGVAEDFAQIVDTAGNESVAAGFACNQQCLVSKEGSPLEPGVFELKHFAPGVGLLLEVDMEGNRLELVEFTSL